MSSKPPRAARSGQHPAVRALREKLDSIQEYTAPAAANLAAEALALRNKTLPPPIERREEGDEDPIHVDVIELPESAPLPKRREK